MRLPQFRICLTQSLLLKYVFFTFEVLRILDEDSVEADDEEESLFSVDFLSNFAFGAI